MEKTIKQKRSGLQRSFIFISILALIAIGTIFYAYTWYDNAINTAPSDSTELVEFEVIEGNSLTGIAPTLKEIGVINDVRALQIYLRLNNVSPQIKAGLYDLPQNQPLAEVIDILEQGVFKSAITVTLKEGTQTEVIGQIIETQFQLSETEYTFDQDEFEQIVANPDLYVFREDIQTFLNQNKPAGKPLNGFLFPDTYFIETEMTSQEVIEFILENFIAQVESNTSSGSYQSQSITNLYDALTLASIIEAEARGDNDREIISGIFHNRLDSNMPLQADATVNYALGQNTLEVTFEDVRIDSPYNTYVNTGLTPTPINNPGLKAIIAAIQPQASNYFFFIHSTREQQTFYAETFEEHQQNIDLYL